MRSSRFHLVDLTVVVSVVVVGLVLVMPALARARTAARAASCSDNFKMIGLAMHNYNSTHGVFPPGRIWDEPKKLAKDPKNSAVDWNAGAMILPYMDEARLYNSINFSLSWHAPANRTSIATKVSVFLCPEDEHKSVTERQPPAGQPTNVAFSLGSKAWVTHPNANRGPKPEGIFFDNSTIGIRDIIDGTSNTVMASEQIIDQARRGGPGDGGDCFGNALQPKEFSDRTGTRWITGHPSSNYFNGRRTPNHPEPDCFDGVLPAGIGSLNKVPRSRHQNGVHVLRADGSVAMAVNRIDLNVWQALLTRAGQELIADGALTALPARPAAAARAVRGEAANADPNVLFTFDDQMIGTLGVGGPVTDVAKNGKVQLSVEPEVSTRPFAEGHYVGFVISPDSLRPGIRPEDRRKIKVIRATVTEIRKGEVTIQVGPAAAGQLKNGEIVALVRPPGSTTEELREVPDLVEPDGGGEIAGLGPPRQNLKQIGLALHTFHDAHGCFPPAVVFGPDGKPWHSWRVLILPFLEQAALYNEYDFSVPWDDPKNRKVLEKMPAVYRDPVYGERAGHFTHVAVITGPGTAFPSEGFAMKDKKLPPFGGPGTTRIRNVRDGTSLTIFAGSVSPDRKIPWTKPEDVAFKPDFKKLGHAESFAAPHQGAGLFLFGDGTVRAIKDEVSVNILASLFTIDGREIIDDRAIPAVGEPRDPGGSPRGLQLIRTREGVKLRFND